MEDWIPTEFSISASEMIWKSPYLTYLWRPELAYLSLEDYVGRRDFFNALCRFSILEYPILGELRKYVNEESEKNEDENTTFGVNELFVENWKIGGLAGTELYNTRLKVRSGIVRDVINEFDKPRGWKWWKHSKNGMPNGELVYRAEFVPEDIRNAFVPFSLQWAKETGRPACYAFGRMYRQLPDTGPLSKNYYGFTTKLAQQTAVSPGEGCNVIPISRADVMERTCASFPPDASKKERIAAIQTALDSHVLTWDTFRLSDLPEWEKICAEINESPNKTITSGTSRNRRSFFRTKGIVATYARFVTLGLIYTVGHRQSEEEWRLCKGWEERLDILKQIRALQQKRQAEM